MPRSSIDRTPSEPSTRVISSPRPSTSTTLGRGSADYPDVERREPQESPDTRSQQRIVAWRIQDYDPRTKGGGTARRVRPDMGEMRATITSAAQGGKPVLDVLASLHSEHEGITNDNVEATEATLLAIHVVPLPLASRLTGMKPESRHITWYTRLPENSTQTIENQYRLIEHNYRGMTDSGHARIQLRKYIRCIKEPFR